MKVFFRPRHEWENKKLLCSSSHQFVIKQHEIIYKFDEMICTNTYMFVSSIRKIKILKQNYNICLGPSRSDIFVRKIYFLLGLE